MGLMRHRLHAYASHHDKHLGVGNVNGSKNAVLPDWFTRLRTHQSALPRFQRWGGVGCRKYCPNLQYHSPRLTGRGCSRSRNCDAPPFVARSLKGAPTAGVGEWVTEHLLDGQQGLTALWRGLHNNYEASNVFRLFQSPDRRDRNALLRGLRSCSFEEGWGNSRVSTILGKLSS